MNLYDITKKYGEGNGEEMMWKTVRIISDSVEKSMDDCSKNEMMRKIYGAMSDYHYNEEYAIKDVEKMFYVDSEAQTHYAPYWTIQQVNDVYESVQKEITAGYNFWDFYVTLQMQMSDCYLTVKGWFPDATEPELDKKIVELAVAWLNDPDNPYDTHKIWGYLNPEK